MIVINSTFKITKGLASFPISTISIHCTITSISYKNGGVINEKSEIKLLVVNKNFFSYRKVFLNLIKLAKIVF